MKTTTFVRTADPPCASRLQYRWKQHIQILVFIWFVYTNNFICGGTGNKSLKSTSNLEVPGKIVLSILYPWHTKSSWEWLLNLVLTKFSAYTIFAGLAQSSSWDIRIFHDYLSTGHLSNKDMSCHVMTCLRSTNDHLINNHEICRRLGSLTGLGPQKLYAH